MIWPDFVQKVQTELSTGNRLFELNVPFEQEHFLTRTIVQGLRTLFAESLNIRGNSAVLHHHVVYRNGDVEEDRRAWNSVRSEKWIQMHGVRYVPDILIRKNLDSSTDILPIEVKYIKKTASTQALATAIGQCLVYSVRYPQAIALIGVKRTIQWGRYRLNLSTQVNEAALHKKLEQNGICLILREVGV